MTRVRWSAVSRLVMACCAAAIVVPMVADAQGGRRRDFEQYFGSADGFYLPPDWHGNPLYDGRVTFVRIKYHGFEHFTEQGPGWSHDYPRAESHFDKIMREISTMRIFVEAPPVFGSAILTLDDTLLMKYPIAYLSEPGGWHMTPSEVAGFRKYISRGGFIIFDDMGCCGRAYTDLPNLVLEWKKAFPDAKLMDLPHDHPIFDSFFKVDFTKVQGYYGQLQLFAFYEDNDPKKRILGVVNNMQDLGDWMEWSDQGFQVTPSNEAYKMAVNYFVYALTH
jgi:hypothetical protein